MASTSKTTTEALNDSLSLLMEFNEFVEAHAMLSPMAKRRVAKSVTNLAKVLSEAKADQLPISTLPVGFRQQTIERDLIGEAE